jgi:hypothetical protein
MTDQGIGNLIVDGLVFDLSYMFANVPDLETPTVVRRGMLQENPVKDRIYILVHLNDPDDPKAWRDSSVAKPERKLDMGDFKIPPFEVGEGGTYMMWRRLTIEFGFYGIAKKESRDEAERQASLVQARIEAAVWRPSYAGQKDALGEVVIKAFVADTEQDPSGGKNAFIWRGKCRIMVLTNRAI